MWQGVYAAGVVPMYASCVHPYNAYPPRVCPPACAPMYNICTFQHGACQLAHGVYLSCATRAVGHTLCVQKPVRTVLQLSRKCRVSMETVHDNQSMRMWQMLTGVCCMFFFRNSVEAKPKKPKNKCHQKLCKPKAIVLQEILHDVIGIKYAIE